MSLNPCPKCQGFVINDFGDVRCMNCGLRPLVVTRPPDPEPTRRRCSSCTNEAVEGKRTCQAHLDYFRDYKLKKKARVEEARDLVLELA